MTNKTTTRHGAVCSMAFGRPSPLGDCARCDELRAGHPARAGWQGAYYSPSAVAMRAAADAYDPCRVCDEERRTGRTLHVGGVCTANQW